MTPTYLFVIGTSIAIFGLVWRVRRLESDVKGLTKHISFMETDIKEVKDWCSERW